MGVRFFVLNSFFLILFALLGLNLYQVQVQQGQYYFKKAQARIQSQENLSFDRGKIFFTDKNGNEIPSALNKNYPIIYAVPKEIKNTKKVANKLETILHEKPSSLSEKIKGTEKLFRLLEEKAKPEQVNQVQNHNIQGVYVTEKKYRFYPFEQLAGPLLGFVGVNENNPQPTGLYGVESYYNKKLASGKDVHLTIDRTLQAEAEKVLSNLIDKYDAQGGSVLIQDPQTGKILSLADKPGFDPNNYSDFPVSTYINDPIEYVYEAGSVFKPLTMAAGLETDSITPDTTYYDKGEVTLNEETIENWDKKAYGKTTMTEVLEHSINTGAVYAQSQIGNQKFLDYLQKFGFGEKTGIDLPDEVSGSLENLKDEGVRQIDFATAAFGQGVSVTPIQLINAYSAIANDGLLMRPFVRKQRGSYVKRRVISKKSADQTSRMLESAVEEAEVADIDGYRIAGKTGTAQIPDFKQGGYSDEYIHNFVGFAPVSDPQFTILVKLDKPEAKLAGRTVVPAFKDLAQFAINYYGISPDDIQGNSQKNIK